MGALWLELLILQTLVGYCFVVANVSIGLYNIRDLNNMKGDITVVKAHKWFGRVETMFFYALTIQCLLMMAMAGFDTARFYDLSGASGIHAMIGGIVGFVLFTTKAIIAYFKKDTIYKIGQYLGPLGFIGWSLAHWTSLNHYYTVAKIYVGGPVIGLIPTDFWFAAILPIPIGLCMFLLVLLSRKTSGKQGRWSTHQIAFILHGITFGYEKAAKDLMGSPALFKYVVPKTYEFLERMMQSMGFDLESLKAMTATEAMQEFARQSAKIGMAEKLKIKWESDNEFVIESVNCSTAQVRSSMNKEELTNAICPWAIMAASIINKVTSRGVEISASEFNEIGALTRMKVENAN